jgi:hypothetical protein
VGAAARTGAQAGWLAKEDDRSVPHAPRHHGLHGSPVHRPTRAGPCRQGLHTVRQRRRRASWTRRACSTTTASARAPCRAPRAVRHGRDAVSVLCTCSTYDTGHCMSEYKARVCVCVCVCVCACVCVCVCVCALGTCTAHVHVPLLPVCIYIMYTICMPLWLNPICQSRCRSRWPGRQPKWPRRWAARLRPWAGVHTGGPPAARAQTVPVDPPPERH